MNAHMLLASEWSLKADGLNIENKDKKRNFIPFSEWFMYSVAFVGKGLLRDFNIYFTSQFNILLSFKLRLQPSW
jgi:hypothetical protein